MRINHNCCIKLVRLVIYIYDARSHIRQNRRSYWPTYALSTGFALQHVSVVTIPPQYSLQNDKRVGISVQLFKILIRAIGFQKDPDP